MFSPRGLLVLFRVRLGGHLCLRTIMPLNGRARSVPAVRDFRGRVAPLHAEEPLPLNLPRLGSAFSASPDQGAPFSVPSADAQRRISVLLLEKALHAIKPASSAWTIFHSDVDVLRRRCALHGIVVADDRNFGEALLRHFFTGFCALARDDAMHLACWEVCHGLFDCADVVTILIGSALQPGARYPAEHLCLIACTVGLVGSGARVKRRKLVSMLEEFRTGCIEDHHEIVPDALFGTMERLVRGSLLSLSFAHGLTLGGDRDCMRDALVLHLSRGDCAGVSHGHHPLCQAVVRQYLMDTDSCVSEVLRIRLLGAVCPFIRLNPLRRVLRLQGVSFDPTSSLGRL